MAQPRPLTDSDAPSAAALLVDAYPHRAHEPERWGRRQPNDERRWVVDRRRPTASLAAYLALWRVQERQFRMDLIVHPQWRRAGSDRRSSTSSLTRLAPRKRTSLQARPYADQAIALRLLEARGFRETMRMTGLELDDVQARVARAVRVARRDARWAWDTVTTLAARAERRPAGLARSSATRIRRRSSAGLTRILDRTASRTSPRRSISFARGPGDFGMIPEACFVAVTDDRYLGYSALTVNDEARTQAGSGGTAVRPEYRGLGVATALKACCVGWAQDAWRSAAGDVVGQSGDDSCEREVRVPPDLCGGALEWCKATGCRRDVVRRWADQLASSSVVDAHWTGLEPEPPRFLDCAPMPLSLLVGTGSRGSARRSAPTVSVRMPSCRECR